MRAWRHLVRPVDDLVDELARRIQEPVRFPYVYAYPPKGAYRPSDDDRAVIDSWQGHAGDLAVYVHVPFCDMKCSFCTLFTTIGQPRDRIAQYVACLGREMDVVLGDGDASRCVARSLYFGGGTPTVLRLDQIERVLTQAQEHLTFAADAEISIESTPDLVDSPLLMRLRDLGFNRVSFGIQGFAADELSSMGRRYDPDLSVRAPVAALQAGIPNVNIDLIFGIPGQGLADWMRNLNQAVEIGVSTITLYPLVVRDRTRYARMHNLRPTDFLGEEEREDWYRDSVSLLGAAGYQQHSEVTFARAGGGCRHESNEFRGVPTLGLGAGARSYAPGLHYTNDDYTRRTSQHSIIDDYMRDVSADRASVRMAIKVGADEQRLRYVILSLLHHGVDPARYERMFHAPVADDFGAWLDALQRCGLASSVDGITALTDAGRTHSALIGHMMFSDEIRAMSEGYR